MYKYIKNNILEIFEILSFIFLLLLFLLMLWTIIVAIQNNNVSQELEKKGEIIWKLQNFQCQKTYDVENEAFFCGINIKKCKCENQTKYEEKACIKFEELLK